MTSLDHGQQTSLRLWESAAVHARSALIQVTSDNDSDRVRGAVDAVVAVEHMAKAVLAALSPALLADRNSDLDTMLHLTGHGQLAKCGPHEIKTIGAHEACIRCSRVVPGFTYSRNDQALFAARNGGAHLALTTDGVARESARIMVRLLEPLRDHMEVHRGQFWADMQSIADTLLDEKTSQINAAVEMRIGAAKRRLQTRLAGLGEDERKLVLKALTAHEFDSAYEEAYECPACDQTGIVTCELHDIGQPEFEYEQMGYAEFIYDGGHIDQVAYAVGFCCLACDLELDYDEMSAIDMLTEFPRDRRECEPWEFEDRPD